MCTTVVSCGIGGFLYKPFLIKDMAWTKDKMVNKNVNKNVKNYFQ